jgi:3-keto-disaccharide hydrolase
MMRGILVGVVALLLHVSGSVAASATCEGRVVLFEDRFDRLQPTWGASDDGFKIEDGQLVVAPEPAMFFWRTNQASLYDDIDMCVVLTTIEGVDPEETNAGLVFWYVDENNFYVFEYAPNGKASVWRRQRGRWLEQVEWKDVEDANEGDDGVNELRVVTRGDRATLYLNDADFAEFDGVPPTDGQQVGVFVASPESGTARFAFDDFRITRP